MIVKWLLADIFHVILSPPSLQIECMVATEMMQRYKKLQFERGESVKAAGVRR